MLRGSSAGGCHIDLARICFGVGDELGDRRGRKGRVDLEDIWRPGQRCDGHDIANEIVAQMLVERDADGVRRGHEKERMAIAGCAYDCLRGNATARTGPALDDKGLV